MKLNRSASFVAYVTLCRIVLGVVLLVSSVPKILHPYVFLLGIYKYELVGRNMGLAAAIILPWLELVLAGCLLSNFWVSGSMMAISGMMAIYTFAIVSVLWRGMSIGCACFGSGEDATKLVDFFTLLRSVLIGVAAGLCWGASLRWPRERKINSMMTPAGHALSVG